ncbi:MAG TPA: DUF4383 domain-containing protein [Streptomyces sp.]|nr:DUF4383 domain-containing protein [Streptomyces sp.]
MASTSPRSTGTMYRTPLSTAAMLVAATFLAVGILGFIPGITTNYGDMTFAGHESGAQLFGLFQVSVLHNLVHLAFGVIGLAMARTVAGARLFLVGGGVIYLLLWIYGLIIDKGSGANFIPLDTADDWLHFVLGVGMIALGTLLSRTRAQATV